MNAVAYNLLLEQAALVNLVNLDLGELGRVCVVGATNHEAPVILDALGGETGIVEANWTKGFDRINIYLEVLSAGDRVRDEAGKLHG